MLKICLLVEIRTTLYMSRDLSRDEIKERDKDSEVLSPKKKEHHLQFSNPHPVLVLFARSRNHTRHIHLQIDIQARTINIPDQLRLHQAEYLRQARIHHMIIHTRMPILQIIPLLRLYIPQTTYTSDRTVPLITVKQTPHSLSTSNRFQHLASS